MSSLAPKGMTLTRLAMALAATKGDLIGARGLAENLWGVSAPVVTILRSAVSAGSIGDPAWAGSLAQYAVAASEFVEALRPLTLLGRMQGVRRAPLQTRIPRATAGTSVGWVGGGSPTPISAMALDSITLDYLKIAGIVVITDELAKLSSPSAEGLMRADLLSATASLSDTSFIDPTIAGIAGVTPASITFGAPTVASSGSTAAAVRADLKALLNLVTTNMASPYLITDRRTAIALALIDSGGSPAFAGAGAMGGEVAGIPLLVTSAVPSPVTTDSPPLPASNIILVDAAEIILADESEVTIDLSDQSTLQMQTAPDSPVVPSTVQVSLWQNNLKALRVVRPINWQLRRPGAVGVLTGVNY